MLAPSSSVTGVPAIDAGPGASSPSMASSTTRPSDSSSKEIRLAPGSWSSACTSRASPEGGLEDLLGVLAAGPVGDCVFQQHSACGATAPAAVHVLGGAVRDGHDERLDRRTKRGVQ